MKQFLKCLFGFHEFEERQNSFITSTGGSVTIVRQVCKHCDYDEFDEMAEKYMRELKNCGCEYG